jgi:hypothetical protein
MAVREWLRMQASELNSDAIFKLVPRMHQSSTYSDTRLQIMIAQPNKLATLNVVITPSLIFMSQGVLRTGTSSKSRA